VSANRRSKKGKKNRHGERCQITAGAETIHTQLWAEGVGGRVVVGKRDEGATPTQETMSSRRDEGPHKVKRREIERAAKGPNGAPPKGAALKNV